jgi:hypothetical protein
MPDAPATCANCRAVLFKQWWSWPKGGYECRYCGAITGADGAQVAAPPAAPVAAARSAPTIDQRLLAIDRRLLVIGLIVAVVAIAYLGSQTGDGGGGGGGGGGGDSYQSEYGGSPAVYQRIAAETDCDALQVQFDQASANHDRDTAAGDLEAMRWSTGYMAAADDRMRAIGCYE